MGPLKKRLGSWQNSKYPHSNTSILPHGNDSSAGTNGSKPKTETPQTKSRRVRERSGPVFSPPPAGLLRFEVLSGPVRAATYVYYYCTRYFKAVSVAASVVNRQPKVVFSVGFWSVFPTENRLL